MGAAEVKAESCGTNEVDEAGEAVPGLGLAEIELDSVLQMVTRRVAKAGSPAVWQATTACLCALISSFLGVAVIGATGTAIDKAVSCGRAVSRANATVLGDSDIIDCAGDSQTAYEIVVALAACCAFFSVAQFWVAGKLRNRVQHDTAVAGGHESKKRDLLGFIGATLADATDLIWCWGFASCSVIFLIWLGEWFGVFAHICLLVMSVIHTAVILSHEKSMTVEDRLWEVGMISSTVDGARSIRGLGIAALENLREIVYYPTRKFEARMKARAGRDGSCPVRGMDSEADPRESQSMPMLALARITGPALLTLMVVATGVGLRSANLASVGAALNSSDCVAPYAAEPGYFNETGAATQAVMVGKMRDNLHPQEQVIFARNLDRVCNSVGRVDCDAICRFLVIPCLNGDSCHSAGSIVATLSIAIGALLLHGHVCRLAKQLHFAREADVVMTQLFPSIHNADHLLLQALGAFLAASKKQQWKLCGHPSGAKPETEAAVASALFVADGTSKTNAPDSQLWKAFAKRRRRAQCLANSAAVVHGLCLPGLSIAAVAAMTLLANPWVPLRGFAELNDAYAGGTVAILLIVGATKYLEVWCSARARNIVVAYFSGAALWRPLDPTVSLDPEDVHRGVRQSPTNPSVYQVARYDPPAVADLQAWNQLLWRRGGALLSAFAIAFWHHKAFASVGLVGLGVGAVSLCCNINRLLSSAAATLPGMLALLHLVMIVSKATWHDEGFVAAAVALGLGCGGLLNDVTVLWDLRSLRILLKCDDAEPAVAASTLSRVGPVAISCCRLANVIYATDMPREPKTDYAITWTFGSNTTQLYGVYRLVLPDHNTVQQVSKALRLIESGEPFDISVQVNGVECGPRAYNLNSQVLVVAQNPPMLSTETDRAACQDLFKKPTAFLWPELCVADEIINLADGTEQEKLGDALKPVQQYRDCKTLPARQHINFLRAARHCKALCAGEYPLRDARRRQRIVIVEDAASALPHDLAENLEQQLFDAAGRDAIVVVLTTRKTRHPPDRTFTWERSGPGSGGKWKDNEGSIM